MRMALVVFLLCVFPCRAEEVLPNATEVVVEASVDKEDSLLNDRIRERHKLQFIPSLGVKGQAVQIVVCEKRAKSAIAESVPAFEVQKIRRTLLKNDYEITIIEGKAGTDVRLAQTFDEGVQTTRFVLGGGPPVVVVDPPDPVPGPTPTPPKPDPVDPKVEFDAIHVVIINDPSNATTEAADIVRDLRLLQGKDGFADLVLAYDVRGVYPDDSQRRIVESYIRNIDSGKQPPYWFLMAVLSGKGKIIKEGALTSAAEVIDEVRQLRRKQPDKPDTAKVVRPRVHASSAVARTQPAGYWKTIPCPT